MDKEKIKYIDIQPFNYCNLSCWFCPPQNKYKEKDYKELTNTTLKNFISLIKTLKEKKILEEEIKICCNRYCEPFYNIEKIIEIYLEIKKILPNCYFEITTNSTLITKEKIDLIKNYNINIIINFYNNKTIKERITFLKDNFNFIKNLNNFKYYNLNITIINDKFNNLISNNLLKDRGGILKIDSPTREEECNIKNNVIVLDYDGFISPCCDLYKKNEEHKNEYNININNIEINNFLELFKNENKKINYNFCKNCSSDLKNLIVKI